MRTLASNLGMFVRAFDADGLKSDDAIACVELFDEIVRLANAGRTLAAGRVEKTRAWRGRGATSARAWLANSAGSSLGDASATLQTAAGLESAPAVREAFVAGRLSGEQAAEITSAAAADPASIDSLLELAERESLSTLRERCRDVMAAAAGDEDATERIRLGRYLRHWSDREGAVRLDARLAADDAAPLIAAINAGAERLRREAARSGAPERTDAYAADALVALASGRACKTVVHVHVSSSALERGHTVAGETCRIDGVGPVSVAAARRLAYSGTVRTVHHDGMDVRRVSRAMRMIPALVRAALENRDPRCVVPGCSRRYGLEIDHIVPFARGGKTELANLARLCRWHHAQKTHHGWRLSGRPGEWAWVHPVHGDAEPARGP